MFIPYRTTNFDDTAARIKKLVAVLDRFWFQNIKKEFEQLCVDGEDYYVIDNTPSEEYLQKLSPEEREHVLDNSFKPVDFDAFWFSKGYSKSKVCGVGVIDKIISTTKEIIDEAGASADYKVFESIIEDVKVWVKEEVENQQDYDRKTDAEYISVTNSFMRKCEWRLDNDFNKKLKVLEHIFNKAAVSTGMVVAPAAKLSKSNFSTDYETDSLVEIFLPDAAEKYKEIEKRLLDEKYIDKHGKWIPPRTLDECAGLINRLLIKGYIIHKKIGYENWVAKTCKPFFEKRYGVKFTKQLQHAYRNNNKLSAFFLRIDFIQ